MFLTLKGPLTRPIQTRTVLLFTPMTFILEWEHIPDSPVSHTDAPSLKANSSRQATSRYTLKEGKEISQAKRQKKASLGNKKRKKKRVEKAEDKDTENSLPLRTMQVL